MIELDNIAAQFIENLKVDQTLADKEATTALMELAEGNDEVYLGLRTQLANKLQVIFENELRNAVAEVRMEENDTPEVSVEEVEVDLTEEAANDAEH